MISGLAPTTVEVSLSEYIHSSYDPDVEFVDGRLEEPVMVQSAHGLLQAWLSSWFLNHRKEWGIKTGVEVRTQVSPLRVRLPDLVVGATGYWPPVLTAPPLIVIEILSPDDRHAKMLKKAQEYSAMGIANIWLIDPETRIVQVWRENAFVIVTTTELRVNDSPVYLDLQAMFDYLTEIQEP